MPNCVQETKSLSARPSPGGSTIRRPGPGCTGSNRTPGQKRLPPTGRQQATQREQHAPPEGAEVLRQGTSLAHQSHQRSRQGGEWRWQVSWGKAQKGPEGVTLQQSREGASARLSSAPEGPPAPGSRVRSAADGMSSLGSPLCNHDPPLFWTSGQFNSPSVICKTGFIDSTESLLGLTGFCPLPASGS